MYLFRKIFFFLSLAFLAVPHFAQADIIPTGYKSVGYCFQISNLDQYKDYTFIAYFGDPMGGHEIIQKDDCVSFYKFSSPTIYAVKNSDFQNVKIPTDYKSEKTFFESNKKLLSSSLTLYSFGTVPENDPTEKVVDVLEIVGISDENLEIKKLKVLYSYENKSTEEKMYTNQSSRPESSWDQNSRLMYILLPTLAGIGIIAVLLARKLRNK